MIRNWLYITNTCELLTASPPHPGACVGGQEGECVVRENDMRRNIIFFSSSNEYDVQLVLSLF